MVLQRERFLCGTGEKIKQQGVVTEKGVIVGDLTLPAEELVPYVRVVEETKHQSILAQYLASKALPPGCV